jgi:glucose-like phosphotransferase system IIB component
MISNYLELTNDLVAAVGGKENIVGVSNCMTRLRFVLKDDTLPKDEEVKRLLGVAGVVKQGGEYQVVIGPEVVNLLPIVRKEIGLSLEENISINIVDDTKNIKLKKNKKLNKKIYRNCIVILSLIITAIITYFVMKTAVEQEKMNR